MLQNGVLHCFTKKLLRIFIGMFFNQKVLLRYKKVMLCPIKCCYSSVVLPPEGVVAERCCCAKERCFMLKEVFVARAVNKGL